MPQQVKHFYEFGPFRLDTHERRLLYKGESIFLTSKAYEILLALVQSKGNVVEKDQLMNKVWPNTFVNEANLTQQIFVLRRILGTDDSQQYIETIPRRGYRFASTIKELEEEHAEVRAESQPQAASGVAAQPSPTDAPVITSLAVLPLTNATDSPNTEYLTDGITESIISNLSQLHQLRVMSWGAVARYKGKNMDVQEIGRELRVQAVLSGKVLQISNRLIIRMEFVDVENGWQYWGMQYNRKVSDLLTIQEDISWEVSERLRLKLSEEDKGRITKRHTESPEAYQHYLKGLYFLNKRNLQWINRAIEHIEEALKIDPNYARAYAALADCYSLFSCHSGIKPREGFPKARAAALKALSLDDSLSEAHASMALVRMLYDWDWTSAENEFRHAIALNANYAMTHHWYSTFLARLGRFDESLAEMKLAQNLDPLSLIITTNQGIIFYFMRNYERALDYANEALELDPNFGVTYGLMCAVHLQQEKYAEALEYCQIGLSLSKRDPEALGFLAMIYGKLGEKQKAHEVIDELREHGQRKYVSPLYIGLAYIGLDEIDRALDCVQVACDERSHAVTYLKVAPFLDRLRSEPQFDELMKCVGLS